MKRRLRLLAEHEGGCSLAKVACSCPKVACSCPGCDVRLPRRDMDAHVANAHLNLHELNRAWCKSAVLDGELHSELRHALMSPTSWVFNWRADGWATCGDFSSRSHTCWGVPFVCHDRRWNSRQIFEGSCTLSIDRTDTAELELCFKFEEDKSCKVHETLKNQTPNPQS